MNHPDDIKWILITDPKNQIPKDKPFLGFARGPNTKVDTLEWIEACGIGFFKIYDDAEILLSVNQVMKEYSHFCIINDQPDRSKREDSWISVKDRMPEEGKSFLLYVQEEDALGSKFNEIYIGHYSKYEWGIEWEVQIQNECYPFKIKVLYWMTLPDKPEVKEWTKG